MLPRDAFAALGMARGAARGGAVPSEAAPRVVTVCSLEEGDVPQTMAAYMSAISRNHIREMQG